MGRTRGGRLHVSHQKVDDETPIIGEAMKISSEHVNLVIETKRNESAVQTVRDHRNREGHYIEFLRKNYPDYYEIGTRDITEEEHNDPMLFFYKEQMHAHLHWLQC